MNNDVLLLGAGIYQVPLIDRIQSRGLNAAVASIPGEYPGIAKCDAFYPVDTTNAKAVLELAMHLNPVAIVTAGTDVALPALATVCDMLNLPGPTQEMVQSASNKLQMKECLARGNARTSAFWRVSTIEEANDALSVLGFPAVFKCVDKSGSRGISIVRQESDVPRALQEALDVSDCDYIVVEQYVYGHEIGVDGFVDSNGSVAFLQVHDKVVWNNGYTDVPIGHKINEGFTHWCATYTDVEEVAKAAIRSIGAKSAFFNMDVMIDPDGRAWIIEVGLRTGATCIPEIISVYYGFDYYDAVLDFSLGDEPVFGCDPVVGAAEGRLLFSSAPAILVSQPILKRDNISISIDTPVGCRWPAFQTGNQRRGQYIGFGADSVLLSLQMEEVKADFDSKCLSFVDELA